MGVYYCQRRKELDTTVLQVLNLIFCIIAVPLLSKVLARAEKGSFVINMVFPFLVLAIVKIIFSGIYLIDRLDGYINDTTFYNIFSAYVSLLTSVIITWVGWIALRRKTYGDK